jgi:4-carboxymuconolactone decarboxylase
MVDDENVDDGVARRRLAQGAKADGLQQALAALDESLAGWADDFVFGRVWASSAISHEERMMVAITALAATNRKNQLRNYLHGALQGGIAPERIREALRMLVVYAGFPIAIDALSEFDSVLSAHQRDSA